VSAQYEPALLLEHGHHQEHVAAEPANLSGSDFTNERGNSRRRLGLIRHPRDGDGRLSTAGQLGAVEVDSMEATAKAMGRGYAPPEGREGRS
jgi:hypothetical protein